MRTPVNRRLLALIAAGAVVLGRLLEFRSHDGPERRCQWRTERGRAERRPDRGLADPDGSAGQPRDLARRVRGGVADRAQGDLHQHGPDRRQPVPPAHRKRPDAGRQGLRRADQHRRIEGHDRDVGQLPRRHRRQDGPDRRQQLRLRRCDHEARQAVPRSEVGGRRHDCRQPQCPRPGLPGARGHVPDRRHLRPARHGQLRAVSRSPTRSVRSARSTSRSSAAGSSASRKA